MPADIARPGSVRSAAQLNQDIRQLWLRARGGLTPRERAEYERLVVAWAVAVKAEIVTAA
jgi:hypothetical protein